MSEFGSEKGWACNQSFMSSINCALGQCRRQWRQWLCLGRWGWATIGINHRPTRGNRRCRGGGWQREGVWRHSDEFCWRHHSQGSPCWVLHERLNRWTVRQLGRPGQAGGRWGGGGYVVVFKSLPKHSACANKMNTGSTCIYLVAYWLPDMLHCLTLLHISLCYWPAVPLQSMIGVEVRTRHQRVVGLPTGGLMHSSWHCESTGSRSLLMGHRVL